ncbi:mannitol 2-dehydrogenase [Prevotella sp. CAG:891]|nr:mannitol 2-dehydrogenase [Prevotella sp. CAG:891]
MIAKIKEFQYNRRDVKAGILHIGVGNFHRAHEEFFTNHLLKDTDQQERQLLKDTDEEEWGIHGAMLLPSDERLYRALKKQEGEYTLTVCGRDGKDEVYRIGSLIKLDWAMENPEAILSAIADKHIRIITLTVTFPNSMVDRITPATRPEDIERLSHKNGTTDEAPVYCEDFIQWVIEDNFIAGRPAWERVGAEFTNDVTAYENMKLSLLNASHTLLSYPSFLSGYRKVDDAMHDDRIVRFVRTFMDKDITPYVPAPGNTDLELYKQTLVERFGNRSVSDQIARLCFDGISKFPVYVMPNLIKMIADGADLTRMAYLIAAYRHYLKYTTDDNGQTFDIAEPWLTETDKTLIASNNAEDFLALSAFQSTDLKKADSFVQLYLNMVEAIRQHGAMAVLESII